MVFGPELLFLLESMYETMKANNGLGLASNQVGLDYRMFVMAAPDEEKLFLVNPVITARSIALANYKEGCLSAPGEFLLLDRAAWVEVKFQNEKGEEQKRLFNAIFAVCVQHEIDHLNGKSHLESKSIPKAQRKLLAKKWGLK
jgi:peptide deformylase